MTERKLFKKVITDRKVVAAIREGCQTSRDIADYMRVHQGTMQTKLQEMHEAGYLRRRKIGQTFFYAVVEGVEIPEDTTESDRAELARKIKEAKGNKTCSQCVSYKIGLYDGVPRCLRGGKHVTPTRKACKDFR